MESREIVRRAIEFEAPPCQSFFLAGSWSDKLSAVIQGFPNDVCDCWETDRGEAGDSESIGVSDGIAEVMSETFYDLRDYWAR